MPSFRGLGLRRSRDPVRVAILYAGLDEPTAKSLIASLSDSIGEDRALFELIELEGQGEFNSLLHQDGIGRFVHLLSSSFMTSSVSLKELLELLGTNGNLQTYTRMCIPVMVPQSFADKALKWDRHSVSAYWQQIVRQLESGLVPKLAETKASSVDSIDALETAEFISEHVGEFFDLVEAHAHFTTPDELLASDERLERLVAPTERSFPGSRLVGEDYEVSRQRLMALERLIWVPSASDEPEFPFLAPKFPATPHRSIRLEDGRELLVKDESFNPTGSHKDRMAWEIVVHYRTLVRQRLSEELPTELPAASIISNGSAASAVQNALRWFGLPDLHVLVDNETPEIIKNRLRDLGCEVFWHDLGRQELDSAEVLRLTENESGFDITHRDYVDPNRIKYYDWLSYEILNLEPKHIFVPVGTGDLFLNIARILRTELSRDNQDSRLKIPPERKSRMLGIGLYGATTHKSDSIMDKLYAKFRPPLEEVVGYVESQKQSKFFHANSSIEDVSDEQVEYALSLARMNNIRTEPSGIAGLARFLDIQDDIPTSERVVVVNTGFMHLPPPGDALV